MRALLFLVFAVSSFTVQANPQPLEYFLKDSDYLDVALSPSGERIAARAQFDGKVVLIVMDRETKEVIGGIQPGSNDAISSFSWPTRILSSSPTPNSSLAATSGLQWANFLQWILTAQTQICWRDSEHRMSERAPD